MRLASPLAPVLSAVALGLSAAALGGCAASAPPPSPEPEDLPVYAGARVRLRTDLTPDAAQAALQRCDALEDALDTALPFLPAPAEAPVVVAVSDPARLALLQREHGLDRPAGAYVVDGVVVVRWDDTPPAVAGGDGAVPLEPPLRPLAAATLRRRLLAGFGPLPPTWLEDALAEVFVEAALGAEPGGRAAARRRERLLDAWLPLFLGAPPALVPVCAARGADERRRSGVTPALAAVAVRFLLADAARAGLLRRSLERAAGLVSDADWAVTTAALAGLDPAFERWLGEAARAALLEQLVVAPWPVDRWEAASALRLLCNVDLDADADEPTRTRQADATRALLADEPPQRFLALFEGELAQARAARSRLQAMAHLKRVVSTELDRRAKGYGHPALEAARADLGRAIQRQLDAAP